MGWIRSLELELHLPKAVSFKMFMPVTSTCLLFTKLKRMHKSKWIISISQLNIGARIEYVNETTSLNMCHLWRLVSEHVQGTNCNWFSGQFWEWLLQTNTVVSTTIISTMMVEHSRCICISKWWSRSVVVRCFEVFPVLVSTYYMSPFLFCRHRYTWNLWWKSLAAQTVKQRWFFLFKQVIFALQKVQKRIYRRRLHLPGPPPNGSFPVHMHTIHHSTI